MSDFSLAIPTILKHEGRFSDNPSDPGGATNYGVSLRWLISQGLLQQLKQEEGDLNQSDVQAVKGMTEGDAEAFYLKYWWKQYSYGLVLNQLVATKIFDTAVNLGPGRAHRFAQEASGATVDGVLGPNTISKINAQPALPLLQQMRTLQAAYYQMLVQRNPKLNTFLKGWLARANDVV